MAKSVALFVFSPIVAAAVGAVKNEGAFVRAIVESRESLKSKNPSEGQIEECLVAMATAFGKEGLSKDSLDGYSSVARKLLGCPFKVLVGACKEGMGRTGVYRRVNDALKPANSTKPRTGRPAGNGAGKTTAKNSGAAVDPLAPAANDSIIPKDGVSPMHRWAIALSAMDSGACIVRDASNSTMTSEDAAAFQKLIKDASMIVGKYTKTAAK